MSRRPSRTPRVLEGSRDPGRWRLGRSPPRPEPSWWAGLGVSYDGGPVASRRLSTSLSDLLNSHLFEQVSTDQTCLRVMKYANGQSVPLIWRHTGLQKDSLVLFFDSCLMCLSSSLSWRQLVVQLCNKTVNLRWGLTCPPLTPPAPTKDWNAADVRGHVPPGLLLLLQLQFSLFGNLICSIETIQAAAPARSPIISASQTDAGVQNWRGMMDKREQFTALVSTLA